MLRTQAALLAHGPPGQAAAALATEVVQAIGGTQCAIGLLHEGRLRIVGASGPLALQERSAATEGFQAAMHEACDQGRSLSWPAMPDTDFIVQAQRQLAGAGAAGTVPLVDGQRIVGALTLLREAGRPLTAEDLLALEDIASFAGPVLEMKRAAAMPWHERLVEAARGVLRGVPQARKRWIAAAVAAIVLAVPVPWRVSAPARLEGAVQRAVVAATDGFLQQASVRPGDRVRQGQVLAELATQDLELERRRRESEVRQHETAYRSAQSRYDRPQMVANQAKAAEAQAMLSLAESQLERSRVVAPFDGLVIKGDLSQNIGAPVQRGEVLMVLTPDDRYRLMLEVDEADIGAVQVGQRGEVALASQPDVALPFVVERIVPVAGTTDGRNVFEVEGRLEQASSTLRPGLGGVAKVEVGARPLAGLLTYRARAWLRMAWWSLMP